jgi:heptaprenyl diphosphate synthase
VLRRFAQQIGIAFQISDDVLDIASDSADSGKTPGTDLREGVATLPVLYALRSTAAEDERLRALVSRPITDDGEVAEALTLLRASSAMGEARATLRGYADASRALLEQLPDLPARSALAALTEQVTARTR